MNDDMLSNSDLDAAVARECGFASPTTDGMDFTPTTDARDAERVWDWLVKKEYQVSVERYPTSAGIYILQGEGDAPDDVDKSWKRSLCLAALRVARKKTHGLL